MSRTDSGLRNAEANEAIKAGRAWMASYTVSDLDQAIALFTKATTAQPDSPMAHSYLAIAATGRTHFVADPKYLELGKSEALKALSLEPNSVDAHRALSGVYFQEGKFHEALEEQMRTIELGGAEERVTIFVGLTLDMLGLPDRSLRWYQVSAKQEETPGEVETPIGDSWVKLGDDEKAFRAYDRSIELQPASSQGSVAKSHLYLLRGEFEAAREICRNRFRNLNELGEMAQVAAQIEFFARNYAAAEELYAKLAKGDAHGGGSFYGAISYQSALGRIKQILGPDDAAAAILRESLERETGALNRQPGNPEAAYRLAAVEASLNLTAASLQHLHQAVALGWLDYRSLRKDPRFDSLRSNPELDTLIDGLSAKVADLRSKAKAR
jgi:tetratricopeptide (TPR) repeat protein